MISPPGHPYEPMLAVSGMDHTIKIFSPDRRAQYEARNGISVVEGGPKRRPRSRRFWLWYERNRRDAEHGAEPGAAEDRLQREWPRRASVTGDSTGDDARSTTEAGNEDGDDDDQVDDGEVDVAGLPARNGGLPGRRRLHELCQIAAQNEQRRQGGVHDARLTVSLQSIVSCRSCVESSTLSRPQ